MRRKFLSFLAVFISGICVTWAMPPEDANLIAFFKGLYWRTPWDCPERWMVNRIGEKNWHHLAFGILRGEIQVSEEEAKKARAELEELRQNIQRGQKWPLRKREKCVIPHRNEDNSSSGIDWSRALVFHEEFKLDSTVAVKSGIKWSLLWDRNDIYIRAEIDDSHIQSIDFHKDQEKRPWDADCIEIFIMPSMVLKSYAEVVINPAGNVFSRLHCSSSHGQFIILAKGPEIRRKVAMTDKGYIVETAIPFAGLPGYLLGNPPKVGQTLFFTLVRINNGEKRSFRPLLYDGHNIFGYMKATLGNGNGTIEHRVNSGKQGWN